MQSLFCLSCQHVVIRTTSEFRVRLTCAQGESKYGNYQYLILLTCNLGFSTKYIYSNLELKAT